jgi:serine/threonine protein kinase
VDLTPGTRVADRYVIDRPLAKGGVGTVYVALDERLRVRVALKVTAAGGTAAAALQARFTREARIGHMLGRCDVGFVRVTDVGRLADDVQLFLAMDLVEDGAPLDLRSGTREERLARWRAAADLVRRAHDRGVVHRDLKPANFLRAPDGMIYLSDFGLAKIVGEPEDEAGLVGSMQTATGHSFGTPSYMPPEQFEDAKQAGVQADVYALGCMLFEALVGQLPYPGPTPSAVMTAQVKVRAGALRAPRPRDVDQTVSAALDGACARATELAVARRTLSVAALLRALADSPPPAERRADAARVARLVDTRDPNASANSPPVECSRHHGPPPSGRATVVMFCLVLTIVGLTTASGYLLWLWDGKLRQSQAHNADLHESVRSAAGILQERDALAAKVDRMAAAHAEIRAVAEGLAADLDARKREESPLVARLTAEVDRLSREVGDARRLAERAQAERAQAERAPPQHPETEAERNARVKRGVCWSLSSTQQEVARIQGTPDSVIGREGNETWFYEHSWVKFADRLVVGWHDGGNLAVKMR